MPKRALAILLTLLVFALHQDLWWWKSARPLVLGTLPPGLAYHALYCLIASLLMWALIRLCWPKQLDQLEHDDSKRP